MARQVMLVTKTWFGHVGESDRAFGEAMLDKFLHALEGAAAKPEVIGFVTEGVRLVAEGSSVLLSLKVLADAGVRVVACQSCLQHYGLIDRVAVGTVGTMAEVVAAVTGADSVVTV